MDQEKIQQFKDQQAAAAKDQQDEARHQELAGSLNNLLLATMVSKDPKMVEVAQNLADLLNSIGDAADKFDSSALHLLPYANQELAASVNDLADRIEQYSPHDLAPYFETLAKQLNMIAGTKPVVNVPTQPVKVDLDPLLSALKDVQKAVKANKVDVPKTDLDSVVKGLKDVQKSINGLSFPVPNYVLPFKDSNGKATQVQLDSSGNLPVSATINTGDIEIGAVELKNGSDDTRATVTASNALKVDGSAVTQPVSAASLPLPSGAATSTIQTDGSQKTQLVDAGGEAVTITGGKLDVNATISGSGGGTSAVDDAAFTVGTDTGTPTMSMFDDVAPDSVNEGDVGVTRMSANRVPYAMLRDAAGNERGANVNASNELLVAVSSIPSHAVTNAGTFAVQNTAALPAGTNNIGDVDVLTVNGVAPAFGSGARGATVQRVTIATDDVVPVTDNGGSLTVDNNGTFAVQTTPTAPTTIYNGKKTVTTAGTRVTLAASQAVKSVVIKALAANTGIIYVGDTSVASTNGFALAAGEILSLDIANLNTVNLDSSVNGEGVTYIGTN